jgi:hypothetical protein
VGDDRGVLREDVRTALNQLGTGPAVSIALKPLWLVRALERVTSFDFDLAASTDEVAVFFSIGPPFLDFVAAFYEGAKADETLSRHNLGA